MSAEPSFHTNPERITNEKILAVSVEKGWKVAGVAVTEGTYGCDTGCEYTYISLKCADGSTQELCGEFGEATADILDKATELAMLFGVPLEVNDELV